MYQSKFIACVMVDNEIVREVRKDGSDSIFLPFGTDYHLRLKNLDHRRAVVSVTIDGEDVLDGSQIVVDGNSTTDLKGFLDSKANVAHNAFRFIEKTEKVKDHRGEKVDDGIVRIEVQFEEDLPQIEQTIKRDGIGYPWRGPWYNDWSDFPTAQPLWKYTTWQAPGSSAGNPNTVHLGSTGDAQIRSCSLSGPEPSDAVMDFGVCDNTNTVNTSGITVTGNVVDQAFTTTHVRRLSAEKVVFVFTLLGMVREGHPVKAPLTVKSKIECHTCGTKSKSGVKYCPECGTCLL